MADKVIIPVLKTIQFEGRLWKPGEQIVVDSTWVNEYGDCVGDPMQSSATLAPVAHATAKVSQPAEVPTPDPVPEPAPPPTPRVSPKRT